MVVGLDGELMQGFSFEGVVNANGMPEKADAFRKR